MEGIDIDVRSEIGELEAVIIHTPGSEVENMTPKNAERALYSDILNLSVARKEYQQLARVLNRFAKTFEVSDLLADILHNDEAKEKLINRMVVNENILNIRNYLLRLSPKELAMQLIEGVVMKRDNLTNFLSKERFAIRPLHNFFFTRDASISMRDEVLVAKMANRVRERESLIMEAIFNYHPVFRTQTVSPVDSKCDLRSISIEGGDILIARDDILLIGNGSRTTTQGIDYILEVLKGQHGEKRHVIVQELPYTPESFIHLDMVFTFLSQEECMVYEPVIFKSNKYQTVHIVIENGEVVSIREENNLLEVLKKLGMDLKPIFCGGNKDLWTQEREQWHSGANFFALAPGKVMGYGRNIYTLEEMNKSGYEIVRANAILNNKANLNDYKKLVVSIEGSELPRGGGGARCMTMPVRRKRL